MSTVTSPDTGVSRPTAGDLVAGISVAVVLIPQSLAYAEIAGVPPYVGLFAAAIPPIAAAFFASSRYLQTGPVAMTALLTFGALQPRGVDVASAEWIQLAALLAVLVGVVRLGLGLMKGGVIAYLLSQPVLKGFTSGAAILIMASQIPTALGTTRGNDNILVEAIGAVTSPSRWDWGAVILSLVVMATILGGRRIHSLFPAVPITIVLGIIVANATDYTAPLVGDIPASFPPISLDLPWGEVPSLLIPALVVALVGFAEPASIARMFASADREPWSANRELVSQGVANLASGISGGFPIGGSFSRTSIARIAGAHTRWSGAIVGLLVLAFLPIAGVLGDLPRAVLAGIIIAAVVKLIRPDELWPVFKLTPPQGIIGAVTFVATLVLSPRIDLGVLIGIVLAVLVHLWRELTVPVSIEVTGSTMRVKPSGVIFFGSAQSFDDAVTDAIARHSEVNHVIIDLEGVGRLDFTAAMTLTDLADHLRSGGCSVELANVGPVAKRIVDKVWEE
jgi:SulP family sulfate permease